MDPALKPGSDQWRSTITASKVASIMGLSKWTGAATLWAEMTGRVSRDTEPTEVQLAGHFMEPFALYWAWNMRGPGWVQEGPETTWSRDDLGFPAAANTDSHGYTPEGELVIVEAKSVGRYADADEWGREDTDEVPLGYYVQVMWQLHMTHGPGGPGITTAYVELVGPCRDDHARYRITYDPELAQAITDRCAAFYATLSGGMDVCPHADELLETVRTFARMNPDIEKDQEWEVDPALAAEYVTADAEAKAAASRLNKAKGEMLRVMGKAQFAVVDGKRVARRKATRGAPTVQSMVKPDALPPAAMATLTP